MSLDNQPNSPCSPSNATFSLENIEIAAPCLADWNEMTGSDQVRFCGSCQLNVYNLSAMTRQQAETLLLEKEGRLCVRLYKRQDGTVITQDCPVGLAIRHQKVLTAQHARRIKLGRNIAAAAVAIFAVAGIYTTVISPQGVFAEGQQDVRHREIKGEMMGDFSAPAPNKTPMTGSPMPIQPPKGNTQVEVGKPVQPQTDKSPAHFKMGKPAYQPSKSPNKEVLTPKKPCKTKKKQEKDSAKMEQGELPVLGRMPVK